MTPTARWAAAQRRRRQIINETVRDRALRDPRRQERHVPGHVPAKTGDRPVAA
ncbi:hypothetical protein SMC26_12905 [Actinomadura fulvescens]|uniref:hypothetical protein n=1 Tax=Actinomadura fulvescens TaxID=46160 RepID=UPI0031D62FC3